MKTDLFKPIEIATDSSTSNDHPNLFAVVWIAIAWIAGSLIFEVTATGAESPPPEQSILQQWEQLETDYAIAFAGIDQFERIQRESELRPVFQAVIASAQQQSNQQQLTNRQKIAKRQQPIEPALKGDVNPKSAKIAVAQKSIQPNGITAIPATIALPSETGSIPESDPANVAQEPIQQIVKQVVHSFQEWMSPVHVGVPQEMRADAGQGESDSQTGSLQSAPKVRDNSDLESVSLSEAQIVRVAAKPVIVPDQANPVIQAPANASEARTATQTKLNQAIVNVNSEPVKTAPVAVEAVQAAVPTEHVAAKWPLDAGNLLAGKLLGGAPDRDTKGVSLNVDKADVRGVIEMLARGYGMNILVAPEVKGTVTANVEGLSPEQALDGVIKMCNLNLQREGDLIYVYPDTKLPSDARVLRVFALDFVRAEVLEPTVQGLLSPVGSAYTTKLDTADNMRTQESIVVIDIPSSIMRVEDFIYQSDRAPRQVMIEAHILEVELKDDMMHGVNFGAILGGDLKVGSIGLADPITSSSANALFFAQIDGSQVKSLVDLLETTTDSKTLASPRLQVINGQNARIQVGEQLGYTVATVTQTSTIQDVQFLETGVVLSVTPTISRDNRILMIVKPEVSDGKINTETLVPDKITREVETSVLLDDHQGVIIGGLIQEKDQTIIRKLPWLGDVKYVGKLFQHRDAERTRTEIIVALTCHIVEPCIQDERSEIDLQRTGEPLFHGLLQRNCRPWEPRMPDAASADKHLDVNKVNRHLP